MIPDPQSDLFGRPKLAPDLVFDIRRMNPWWQGAPMRVLPRTRRNLVGQIREKINQRLAPIVVVRGPRQIGKTIAQLHLIQDLLAEGVQPQRILRVQFDELAALVGLIDPILRIADWFEQSVLAGTFNEWAHRGEPAYLFFDEIQNLQDWAPQLKSLADSSTIHIIVTGSSALRIEKGRDSLAGRISTIEAGTLSLNEIGDFHGLAMPGSLLRSRSIDALADIDFWRSAGTQGRAHARVRDAAFEAFSARGSYPIAHQLIDQPWHVIADQLNETVVRRVIRHDLRMGERGRKRDEALLEELFRLACRYAGQAPTLQLLAREAQRALSANIGAIRVNRYLRFLGGTLLLRLIEPMEIRLKKRRGAVKICLADHGLRASWLQEEIPLSPVRLAGAPHLTDLAGHIAESAVGAALCTVGGLDVAHFPERPTEPEIDFVLTIGTRRIPVEVKYQRQIDPLRHTEGLRSFLERSVNNAPFGLLVTQTDDVQIGDPRIVPISLSSFLLVP